MASSVSPVRIGNLALGHIGSDNSIEALDENSPEAKQVDLWYDFAREQALADYDWNFARKRLALAAHEIDPPAGVWAYRYQYPSDCISARAIEAAPTETPVPYDIEAAGGDNTMSILTNRAQAVLVYTRDNKDTTTFSPHFAITMSYLLAHYISFPLTRKKKIKEDMFTAYRGFVPVAATINLNESMPAEPPDAGHIQARN